MAMAAMPPIAWIAFHDGFIEQRQTVPQDVDVRRAQEQGPLAMAKCGSMTGLRCNSIWHFSIRPAQKKVAQENVGPRIFRILRDGFFKGLDHRLNLAELGVMC